MSRKIPENYSPAAQIQHLFVRPELRDFVGTLHRLAQEYAHQPVELQQHVMDYLSEHEELSIDSNRVIRSEYAVGDRKLKTVTFSIFNALYQAINHKLPDSNWKYQVWRVCNGVMRGTECTNTTLDYFPTDHYILDDIVVEEGLFNSNDDIECNSCGRRSLATWSTSNALSVGSPDIVKSVNGRLKSDGRRNSKLTEIIMYGLKGSPKLRHIDDDYGAAIILNRVEDLVLRYPAAGSRVVNYIQRTLADRDNQNFLRSLGIDAISRRNHPLYINQQLHYAVLCTLRTKVDRNSIPRVNRGLDDRIAEPRARRSWIPGVKGTKPQEIVHHWKGLLIPIRYKGMKMEIQIKSDDVYQRELDPTSPLFHLSYARRERSRQNADWTEAHWIILNALNSRLWRRRETE